MSAGTNRRLGRALLAGSIVLSAAGQLGMKAGMQELHALAARGVALSSASWGDLGPAVDWTFAGLTAYGLSLLCWLAVLVRYPLSYAYPLLGLAYVLVYVGATQWPRLAEPASLLRTGGTLLILAGVALVTIAGTAGGPPPDRRVARSGGEANDVASRESTPRSDSRS